MSKDRIQEIIRFRKTRRPFKQEHVVDKIVSLHKIQDVKKAGVVFTAKEKIERRNVEAEIDSEPLKIIRDRFIKGSWERQHSPEDS